MDYLWVVQSHRYPFPLSVLIASVWSFAKLACLRDKKLNLSKIQEPLSNFLKDDHIHQRSEWNGSEST